MTIEKTKKQLPILGAIIAIILFVGGYTLFSSRYSNGYNDGYAEGHNDGYTEGHSDGYAEGVAKTEKKYMNPKGTGLFWYAEEINNGDDFLYHSTTLCPYKRNGIKQNWGFSNPNYRKQHSQFCPKCMDFNLIKKCEEYLYTDKTWR